MMPVIGYEQPVLVHWTYRKEEWRSFCNWRRRQGGWLSRCSVLAMPFTKLKAPEVTVTSTAVWTNDVAQGFNGRQCILSSVSIADAGEMNVFFIQYINEMAAKRRVAQIELLVPRGRLREAIMLHELLSGCISRRLH